VQFGQCGVRGSHDAESVIATVERVNVIDVSRCSVTRSILGKSWGVQSMCRSDALRSGQHLDRNVAERRPCRLRDVRRKCPRWSSGIRCTWFGRTVTSHRKHHRDWFRYPPVSGWAAIGIQIRHCERAAVEHCGGRRHRRRPGTAVSGRTASRPTGHPTGGFSSSTRACPRVAGDVWSWSVEAGGATKAILSEPFPEYDARISLQSGSLIPGSSHRFWPHGLEGGRPRRCCHRRPQCRPRAWCTPGLYGEQLTSRADLRLYRANPALRRCAVRYTNHETDREIVDCAQFVIGSAARI
jgi:hypothetical protein